MLQLHLPRHEHCADFQIAGRTFPAHPLEHLTPMLLPVLRQIEAERRAEAFWRAVQGHRLGERNRGRRALEEPQRGLQALVVSAASCGDRPSCPWSVMRPCARLAFSDHEKTWVAGTSPAMTNKGRLRDDEPTSVSGQS